MRFYNFTQKINPFKDTPLTRKEKAEEEEKRKKNFRNSLLGSTRLCRVRFISLRLDAVWEDGKLLKKGVTYQRTEPRKVRLCF